MDSSTDVIGELLDAVVPDEAHATMSMHRWSDRRHPAWSPDGKRVAYADGPTFHTTIHVTNADASGVRQVTTLPDSTHRDEFPAWSPDGTRLVFHRFDFTPNAKPPMQVIYVVNRDGRGLRRVSLDSLEATQPTW